jgi:hydroxymethylbilane synthase
VEGGEYDAIVLAKAGLDRLGWGQRISETFSPEVFMPAVGQGAIAVETRLGDNQAAELVEKLDDAETRSAIIAERALLKALQGGCQVPIGAWARIERGEMVLEACVTSVDGLQHVKQRLTGMPEQGVELGEKMARLLIDSGAQAILSEVGRQRG